MNPSIKTPELTIQGSSQKIELHICKSTSRKKFCQEATSSARPTVQALNLEIEGIHINSNYNLSLATGKDGIIPDVCEPNAEFHICFT